MYKVRANLYCKLLGIASWKETQVQVLPEIVGEAIGEEREVKNMQESLSFKWGESTFRLEAFPVPGQDAGPPLA